VEEKKLPVCRFNGNWPLHAAISRVGEEDRRGPEAFDDQPEAQRKLP
jgi:hypothetical protein